MELSEKTTELNELKAYKGEVDKIKKSIGLMKDNLKIKTELNEKLQKELNELNKKMEEKESKEKEKAAEIEKEMEKLREEASQAKLQLATDSFEKQEEIIKLKRFVKKYQTKLESMGVNINSIK